MVQNASTVPVIVARALVKLKDGLVPLHIINTNLTSAKIYKGSTVVRQKFYY